MRPRDVVELIALAAIWGASFLFMRIAAPAFGPLALSAVRVAGAALLLLPMLVARGQLPALRRHWRPIALVGLTNSALPFACFSYAALTIDAGVTAIFNSATPLFAALVAWLWLADRLTPWRVVGLVIGFAGVVWVALGRSGVASAGSFWADRGLPGGDRQLRRLAEPDEALPGERPAAGDRRRQPARRDASFSPSRRRSPGRRARRRSTSGWSSPGSPSSARAWRSSSTSG